MVFRSLLLPSSEIVYLRWDLRMLLISSVPNVTSFINLSSLALWKPKESLKAFVISSRFWSPDRTKGFFLGPNAWKR